MIIIIVEGGNVVENKEKRSLASEIIRKMFWIIILLIVALVGTNIGWLIYETQYETSYTTQTVDMDTEGSGINNYVGNNGDINNGKDKNS